MVERIKACRGWKENDGNQSTISKPELDSSWCHRGRSRKGHSNFTSPVSSSKQIIINTVTTNRGPIYRHKDM